MEQHNLEFNQQAIIKTNQRQEKQKKFTFYAINELAANSTPTYYDSYNKSNNYSRKAKSNKFFVTNSTQKKTQKQGISKILNKIQFLNSYENCKNIENYHVFKNLNLKFLKQNYKFKDNYDDQQKTSFNKKEKEDKFEEFHQQKQYIENSLNYNNIYYESLRLQPYTFIKDPKVIEENTKSGRYLKGVIRINKCHTHGYITVAGLVNDILIRGNRNLNQSLHLDEVIVELFPMMCWKPLFNKKIRKLSDINEENKFDENMLDMEKDKERGDEIDNILQQDPNNNESKYKEVFDSDEERLKYINKFLNLRPEGRIVKIIHSVNHEKNQIVTIDFDKSSKLVFATPIDENIPKIFIKMKKINRLEFLKKVENDFNFKKKYFIVKIVGWALNFKCPKGIITDELGNSGNVEVETDVLLRTFGIDYIEYPTQVIEEVKIYEKGWMIPEDEIKKRLDLRNELIFTIDPKHSKDLDDAIHIKLIDETKKLYQVGVHIADASYFLNKDSFLDKEALNRATTVYLVHKNIPMLPRILSENIISLIKGQERLTVSCFFNVYENGELDENSKPEFRLSIIKSASKLSYELAQKMISDPDSVQYDNLEEDQKPASKEILEKMKENLNIINNISKFLKRKRIENGALIIDNKEVCFELDENSKPNSYFIKSKQDTNHMIEELMLLANKFCAEFIYDNLKESTLIRRHSFLNDNKFSEIQRYIITNKLYLEFETSKELNSCLDNLKQTESIKYICLQHKLRYFMQRAEYIIAGINDKNDLKHSALNFNLYTHFTSPIRRYPDIVVHRLIKYCLDNQYQFNKIDDSNVDNFNSQYINAKLISQKCQRLFHCMLVRSNPGKIYRGYVVDIAFKNQKNNKRMSQADIANLSLQIYLYDMCLEIEWKREDQMNLLDLKYNINENNVELSYRYDDQFKIKTIKVFDEIELSLTCLEKIPLDLKCCIILNNN